LCQLYNDPSCQASTVASWREIALEDEEYVGSEKYVTDQRYWTGQMRQAASLFTSRYLRAFDKDVSPPSRCTTIPLSRNEFDQASAFAAEVGGGVAHYFLALLAVYFANSSGRDHLVFGLPFHNRRG